MPLEMRTFGTKGPELSAVGLGGEGILRTRGLEKEATQVIGEALNQGLTYFDSAVAYADSQNYYGLIWKDNPGLRADIFQTSKSAGRSRGQANQDLENTLRVMGIEHLDLWQIHDLRTKQDFETIAGPNGALEAFVQAKKDGKVRFIGVTGHHDPALLTRAIDQWPVDAVLLPVNPVEACLDGFMDRALPEAQKKGLAVIAMKVLGAAHYLAPETGVTAEKLIRYALSQKVTQVIVGCSSPREVQTLARAGTDFSPMSAEEQMELTSLFQPQARRLAFYRGWA